MDILNDFGVKPILLAAQVVNFFVLLFILQKFLYKPLLKVLADRKKTIASSLKNAEKIEQQLLKTEQDREQTLDQASKEAQKMIDQATKAANSIIVDAHAKAAADIQELLERNRQSMKQEREQLRSEVRADAAHLIALSLQKITGKVLTSADQKKLIDQSVKGINE